MASAVDVALVDYGMGNLHSVSKALEHAGARVRLVKDANDVRSCERLVLPGVGAFRDCIHTLNSTGMADAIRQHIKQGHPFLGICLGMQVLMDVSQEFGRHRGMEVIPGAVKAFPEGLPAMGCKIPHMGWNDVLFSNEHDIHPVLAPLRGQQVYYVHAYYCAAENPEHIQAACSYGSFPFAAAIGRDNIIAVQFHPEKSQRVGLEMLQEFIQWKA